MTLNIMITLQPIETIPVILLKFTSQAPADLIQNVKERFLKGKILVINEERDEEGSVLLGLTTTQDELEMEAEQRGLVKPAIVQGLKGSLRKLNGAVLMEPYTKDNKEDFLRTKHDLAKTTISAFDQYGLFTSSDRIRLVMSIIENMSLLADGESKSKLSNQLHDMNAQHQRDHSLQRILSDLKKRGLKSHTNLTQNESSMSFGDHSDKTRFLIDELRSVNAIDMLTPIHNRRLRNQIFKHLLSPSFRLNDDTVTGIRDYYGEEVTYYFAWMKFYIGALGFPALAAVFLRSMRQITGLSIDQCFLTPFYGLLTFVWSCLFIKFWTREENRLASRWGTFSSEENYDKTSFSTRHEFHGTPRVSPVTGNMELYYPQSRRVWQYLISAMVTLILLTGAFFVMIMSLNLQGYIHNRIGEDDDHVHPFHYPLLSSFAEEGNIFDIKSSWKCYIPGILHAVLVLLMNMGFRIVAEKLTEWENHETKISHENSLILKRFLFEAFDAYLALFYLAFYEQSVEKVSSELVVIFNISTVQRLLVEVIIPLIKQHYFSQTVKKNYGLAKKNDDNDVNPLVYEAKKDFYEEFDDYISMIIQLGYITLFASAYPLASFVAMISNMIEIRFDMFKLATVCLRPRSVASNNIGMWKSLMKSILWLSAMTNCLIFCFTSRQMYHFVPHFFSVDETGEHDVISSNGLIVAFLIFGIERLLLICAVFIDLCVPDIPEDVIVTQQKQRYIYYRENQQLRSKSFLTGPFNSNGHEAPLSQCREVESEE